MAQTVADLLWEMLEKAGVQRCYEIVGDALNPVIDALHRNGNVDFVHVRHEEYGVFSAVADAYFTSRPVAVCGTAGPGRGDASVQRANRCHEGRRACHCDCGRLALIDVTNHRASHFGTCFEVIIQGI